MPNTKIDYALILDLKATDSSVKAHAVQIAWNVVTAATGVDHGLKVIKPSYHVGGHTVLLRPLRKISADSLGACAIDMFAIKHSNAPRFDDVIPAFMQSNDCEYIICHNARRTKQLLKNARVPACDTERVKFICIESLARQLIKLTNYSTPTLYAWATPNTAHEELRSYYNGKYDPLCLRIIYERLAALFGLTSLDCAYQKSIDPKFDVAAYHEALRQNRPEPDYCEAVHELIAQGDGKPIDCFVSNTRLHDAIASIKDQASIVASDGNEFVATDGLRYKFAAAYIQDENYRLVTLMDAISGDILVDQLEEA